MPTVLMGWELGAGTGHLQRLVPLVTAYLAKGFNVVTAVRDVRSANTIFGVVHDRKRLRIVQAPIFLHHSQRDVLNSSLAEVFNHIGFTDPAIIRPVVRSWEALLLQFKPEVIISDNAPSLNIAAHRRLPVMVVGNGWTIPPKIAPLPSFSKIAGSRIDASILETRILSAIDKVIDQREGFAIFADLLRGAASFPSTFFILDPYKEIRTEPLYWPIEIPSARLSVENRDRQNGLLYLPAKHHLVRSIAHILSRVDFPFKSYVPNPMGIALPPSLKSANTPIDLALYLPKSKVMVHHGGLGTATWCLVNNIPQVICPQDIEKSLIAESLERERSAVVISANMSIARLVRKISAAADTLPSRPSLRNLVTFSQEETCAAILRYPK